MRILGVAWRARGGRWVETQRLSQKRWASKERSMQILGVAWRARGGRVVGVISCFAVIPICFEPQGRGWLADRLPTCLENAIFKSSRERVRVVWAPCLPYHTGVKTTHRITRVKR